MDPHDPFVGKTLPGGHLVMELIGTGGMGRVYRAEQKTLGRTVAVKVVHPHLSRDRTVEARFFTEAKAASRLNHPNSVNIIDFGLVDSRPYIVMEFLRGRDLTTVNEQEGPLGEERIVDVLGQVLAALEEAHHLDIVHRDLKPENIILQPLRAGGDVVKVVDFGLAIIRERAQMKRLTVPGMVCGTPQYMAPEQARGDDVDARADLYACGVILYELLAGKLPFDSSDPHEIVAMQLHDAPPDPREVAPDREISAALAEAAMRALSKPPTERFQSAPEFTAALEAALTQTALSGRRSGQRVRCPQCRELLKSGDVFCGQCGARVRRSSAPPIRIIPLTPAEPAISVASTDVLGGELVGRQDVLEWFDQRRARAGATVYLARLVGPAGVGRTRLLADLALRAERDGDVVVSVGPDPWRAGVGYYALREAISVLAELPADGGGAAQWSGASAEARAGLGELYGPGYDRQTPAAGSWSEAPPLHLKHSLRRGHTADALRWALDRAQQRSATGRVTLLIDDLHAVDGASGSAFADVAEGSTSLCALIVAAHCPDFEPTAWRNAEQRRLEGLDESHVARLLDKCPVSVPPGADGPAASRTDRRLPLYLDQLIRFAAEGGDEPPEKLSDLVALRVERLPAARRRVLQAVAVLGDGAPVEHVQAMVVDVKTTAVEDPMKCFEALDRAGLVLRRDGLVSVSHPFIRDVVLFGTPVEVRRRLHRKARHPAFVEALSTPIEARAQHAMGAEDAFEALMLADEVAMTAAERGDLDGCVNVLRQGLELARREMSRGELEDPVGAQLHFATRLADALALRGSVIQADGVLREALDLGGPRAAERPRLLASHAHVNHLRGRHAAAKELLREARALAEQQGRRGLVAAIDRLPQAWEGELELDF